MSAFACLSSSPAELAISLSHSFHARAHTRTHARTHARTHLPGARTCTVTDGACVTVAGVAAVPAPRHADAGPPRPRERAAAHAVYLAAVLLLRQHRVQGLLLCLLFACASTSRCSLVALSLLSRCSLVALSLLSRCSLVALSLLSRCSLVALSLLSSCVRQRSNYLLSSLLLLSHSAHECSATGRSNRCRLLTRQPRRPRTCRRCCRACRAAVCWRPCTSARSVFERT
jgi:hypothetical protein